MKTFTNDYKEPNFITVNKSQKTVLTFPQIKFYRRLLTVRRVLNHLLRVPQRSQIVRVQERVAKVGINNNTTEVCFWKKLDRNIIMEHKKFKNKVILTTKTDINTRYLQRI